MDMAFMALSFFAAVAAGIVNAIAGGGTLITFPLLTALGLPALSANITNTVALCPGYLGGTWAQRKELKEQRRRLALLLSFGIAGGVAGGFLLLKTGEKRFTTLIPWLILFSTILIAIQPAAKKMIAGRKSSGSSHRWISIVFILIPATLYGGYFGAGVSIIILAALGLMYNESLTSLNALKQLLSLCINVAAAVFFLFSNLINWPIALVMATGAITGGYLGGKLAGIINPVTLRRVIVMIGLAVSVYYFCK
ncbi:MAG TPA: sulfite exporter TauE/SafE family protein [Bacteroidales bacterium]|nr:sulfite exporter TauE/SafE family protein [Bacteroidales bacterium]HPT12286.1 sulfite exporter TauE/SafE family protein [Bacteroidales bacterium]